MADLRQDIAKELDAWLTPEQLSALLDEILAITKSVHADVTCKKCNATGRYSVQVPDAKAVVSAIADLANQGFGRPGERAGDEDEKIVFERVVYLGDE